MKETLKFAREELEKDSFVPVPAEKVRIDAMVKWMREGGALYDKLKIRYYGADNRGVHASQDIKKGETIIYVPKEEIITLGIASLRSTIGALMKVQNLNELLISPK